MSKLYQQLQQPIQQELVKEGKGRISIQSIPVDVSQTLSMRDVSRLHAAKKQLTGGTADKMVDQFRGIREYLPREFLDRGLSQVSKKMFQRFLKSEITQEKVGISANTILYKSLFSTSHRNGMVDRLRTSLMIFDKYFKKDTLMWLRVKVEHDINPVKSMLYLVWRGVLTYATGHQEKAIVVFHVDTYRSGHVGASVAVIPERSTMTCIVEEHKIEVVRELLLSSLSEEHAAVSITTCKLLSIRNGRSIPLAFRPDVVHAEPHQHFTSDSSVRDSTRRFVQQHGL